MQNSRPALPGIARRIGEALALSPGNARAMYYLALVERNKGNPDATIEELKKAVGKFPRSRGARRELGFLVLPAAPLSPARDQNERLQDIDPDDLAAHYNLSLIYRRWD